MSLWNIIRDWFVQNIWGGHYLITNGTWVEVDKRFFVYALGRGSATPENAFYTSSVKVYGDMCLGDWLSTTSTILVLLAVCFGLYCLTRYFFRMFAGLLSGR